MLFAAAEKTMHLGHLLQFGLYRRAGYLGLSRLCTMVDGRTLTFGLGWNFLLPTAWKLLLLVALY